MSGQPPGGPAPPGPRSASNGPPNAAGPTMPPQHQQHQHQPQPPQSQPQHQQHQHQQPPVPPPPQSAGTPVGGGPSGGSQTGNISQQNLNSIVIEYLSKKGYSRTEAMLRMESANQDAEGRPIHSRIEESGGDKYLRAFGITRNWIDDNLDIYKPELKRLLWPLFVYSFLNLALDCYPRECERFFLTYRDIFTREHGEDVRALGPIRLPEHVHSNEIAKIYRGNKYRLTLSTVAFYNLITFLESKEKEGGAVIVGVIQNHCNVITVDRGAAGDGRLASLLRKGQGEDDIPAEDEGIPGHNPGSANTDKNAPAILPKLRLDALPMEPELLGDVQAELEEEDAKNPPVEGQNSLVQEFDRHIKREESEDAPRREDVPLPPSVARDVTMEVLKVKENRDRFQIPGRTGGVGPGVSITMFTFHNTHDSINCLDFSQDNVLVAAGMEESYIRVWNLEGKPITSIVPTSALNPQPSASRRLVGHAGPVYAVSFSPSIANPDPSGPSTAPRFLLSSSADKTVRIWSLETWTNVVVYKGHDHPVWDVTWGPYGHYFLTGSHDKTARLWSTAHISSLRIFAGHDQDVDTVCFHPNSAYVFTGSSDKSVRMWAVTTGNAVRLFTGHTGNVTSMACSPDGKTLASADDAGSIFLWDLASGRRTKRMRGHGKGGIWSLSWSVESTALVSGGADGTVRVWDVLVATEGQPANAQGKIIAEGGAGTKIDGGGGGGGAAGAASGGGSGSGGGAGSAGAGAGATTTNAAGTQGGAGGAGGAGGGGKRKGKEVVVTPDQISAFPTKKSPVYRVRFTRQNLVLAGGAYLP